jgi:hypothetical protein
MPSSAAKTYASMTPLNMRLSFAPACTFEDYCAFTPADVIQSIRRRFPQQNITPASVGFGGRRGNT